MQNEIITVTRDCDATLIPAGEEILTNLTYSNNNLDVLCINSITISDGSANALSFTIHHNSLCSE